MVLTNSKEHNMSSKHNEVTSHTNVSASGRYAVAKNILFITLFMISVNAHATLNIFACEPEWAALSQELAGDKADIYAATSALQDPHHAQARPSLIAHARRAQLVVCTGAEQEIGWLPLVLHESSNPAIAVGQPGYFEATRYVHLLEVPDRLDRADGDVHAAGNPHIQLDPRNYLPVARALSAKLAELDPANAAFYAGKLKAFDDKWNAAIKRWEVEAAPLKGQSILVQHRAYPYLEGWLGLKQVAELEPKPGMEPTAAHLAQVLAEIKQHPARMVIRASYQDSKPSAWIAEHAHIKMVELPFSVGGTENAKDLYSFFDDIIARLLGGLK
jgi:zinc/manganese transport system substrate-binding protein